MIDHDGWSYESYAAARPLVLACIGKAFFMGTFERRRPCDPFQATDVTDSVFFLGTFCGCHSWPFAAKFVKGRQGKRGALAESAVNGVVP